MKKYLVIALAGLFLAVGGGVAFLLHSKAAEAREVEQRREAREEAERLLSSGRTEEALVLLQAHFKPQLAFGELREWPLLMVEAAAESRRFDQLEHLVVQYPATLRESESAALWWLRMQLHRGQWLSALPLLEHWPEERRQQKEQWKLLEADRLLQEGKVREARSHLQSWNAEGPAEVNRQLRLALLAEDETEILGALNDAFQEMPDSADLRAAAAEYLERLGDPVRARREYVAAALLEPENPFHAHQLARFYLRSSALPQAIETWRDCFARTGDDRSWFGVLFWERITQSRGEALTPRGEGWWGGATAMLAATADDRFLPTELMSPESAPPILERHDDFRWLRVCQHLQDGDETAALEILAEIAPSPVTEDLRQSLFALLGWRVRGEWPESVPLQRGTLNHRFLATLQSFRPTGDGGGLAAFFSAGPAPACLLLAYGWTGAADRLMPDISSVGLPAELDWLPYAYCQMRSRHHGREAGIKAAALFPDDLAVAGYAGELMLSAGDTEAGLAMLEKVSADPGGAGYRATYLLALADLERGAFESFEARMAARPELAESAAGGELRARAALARGAPEQALEIYESLGEESLEGCVYRYRIALDAGRLEEARIRLDELIRLSPNEPVFDQWRRELDDAQP